MKKERFKVIVAVYLILHQDKKVLLSRRYNTGFHDGDYGLPSGHVDGGETLIQAMIREAKEEVGIAIKSEDLKFAHVIHRRDEAEERLNIFFFAQKWEGEPKIMESEKCDDLQWFLLDGLPNNTIDYIRRTIPLALAGVTYSEYGWEELGRLPVILSETNNLSI